MSHSSGISVGEDLKTKFSEADKESSPTRLLIVQIENENLSVTREVDKQGGDQEDFKLISPAVPEVDPCYVLYRLDSFADTPCWLFILYVPSGARVRDRMMYASTRTAVKNDLCGSSVQFEYFASEAGELCFDELVKLRDGDASSVALSESEINALKEQNMERDTGAVGAASIQFPTTQEVKDGITALAAGESGSAVVVNIVDEEFTKSADIQVQSEWDLPMDAPRFVFFSHQFSNGTGENKVFKILLFWSPDEAKIKQKMTFAAAKQAAIGLASGLGFTPDKVIEAQELSDANLDAIGKDLLPSATETVKPAPSSRGRPSRPGKGSRRLI